MPPVLPSEVAPATIVLEAAVLEAAPAAEPAEPADDPTAERIPDPTPGSASPEPDLLDGLLPLVIPPLPTAPPAPVGEPARLPVPARPAYAPLITDAPGLNWVGPGDAWTRAWAAHPPTVPAIAPPARPASPAVAPGGSGPAFPPLLDPATAVAVIPLAARARSSESDIVLVRRSLAAVESVADRAVAHFYALLFVANPELRALFPAAMDLQRDRLFRALLAAAKVADDPDALSALLVPLARGHRKYGVKDEHYPPVGAALVATLQRYAGGVWDRHHEAAWGRVYGSVSRMMIEAAKADAVSAPPWWQAEVVAVTPLTGEISQVTVRTDQPYPYRAGQYATVEVPMWPRVWRAYSPATAPRADGLLTFQVKAVPAGWVSNALVRRTGVGDVLRLGPAVGTMVLRPGSLAPLLMVGGGTGIAPILALIEELASRPQPQRRSVEVLYGARREADLYARERLAELAKRHSWLSVRTTVMEGPHEGGLCGSLADVVAEQGPWEEYEAYVSGPPAMVRRTVRALQAAGADRGRIHHDLGEETLD